MNLHNEIMNLPTKHDNRSGAIAYKEGHRDARHAAAELSLKYERYIKQLEEAVNNYGHEAGWQVDLIELKRECGL